MFRRKASTSTENESPHVHPSIQTHIPSSPIGSTAYLAPMRRMDRNDKALIRTADWFAKQKEQLALDGATTNGTQDVLKLEDKVSLANVNAAFLQGLVVYVGDVHFARGIWVGIQLTGPSIGRGNCNGIYHGKKYFANVGKNNGIMAPLEQVHRRVPTKTGDPTLDKKQERRASERARMADLEFIDVLVHERALAMLKDHQDKPLLPFFKVSKQEETHITRLKEMRLAQVMKSRGMDPNSNSNSNSSVGNLDDDEPAVTHDVTSDNSKSHPHSHHAIKLKYAPRDSPLQACDYELAQGLEMTQQNYCLSDPTLPDNPITYASQAFLNMTGYDLNEILGRNCRFLQGPRTCQTAITRIRVSIQEGADCHVCLLNYKKDGTPFYNRLFMTALRDTKGRVKNYLGVQCQVSEQVAHQINNGPPLAPLSLPPPPLETVKVEHYTATNNNISFDETDTTRRTSGSTATQTSSSNNSSGDSSGSSSSNNSSGSNSSSDESDDLHQELQLRIRSAQRTSSNSRLDHEGLMQDASIMVNDLGRRSTLNDDANNPEQRHSRSLNGLNQRPSPSTSTVSSSNTTRRRRVRSSQNATTTTASDTTKNDIEEKPHHDSSTKSTDPRDWGDWGSTGFDFLESDDDCKSEKQQQANLTNRRHSDQPHNKDEAPKHHNETNTTLPRRRSTPSLSSMIKQAEQPQSSQKRREQDVPPPPPVSLRRTATNDRGIGNSHRQASSSLLMSSNTANSASISSRSKSWLQALDQGPPPQLPEAGVKKSRQPSMSSSSSSTTAGSQTKSWLLQALQAD